jgi:phosphatidate cytidylyltransferase
VSPNKTVEGALGGVLLSIATAGVAAALLEAPAIAGFRFLVFGLAVSLAAMVGDLAESLVKRDAGVKDSASWIPGFGGVLDMTDSLTIAGPIALAALEGLSRA